MQASKGLIDLSGTLLFRVDASSLIGSGHLMRCLTLADQARSRGWQSFFVMRDLSRELIYKVKASGHTLHHLVEIDNNKSFQINELAHSDWLNVSQETDAIETTHLIKKINPDWVIVDHYSIDAAWHTIVKKTGKKLLVIDDLADRVLNCDILINQNLGFSDKDYAAKVKADTQMLFGPKYALLRPEFREWREFSLSRRTVFPKKRVLITMGGVDAQNHTLKVLETLERSVNAHKCEFLVVLGSLYPYVDGFNEFMENSRNEIRMLTNIDNMAEMMANSDVCIGAAGSSSWERCCLGLPTLTVTIAENQKRIAASLHDRQVAVKTEIEALHGDFDNIFSLKGSDLLVRVSFNGQKICDGLGSERVVKLLEKNNED